jgi:ATP-dependent protease ClpP protease subunit
MSLIKIKELLMQNVNKFKNYKIKVSRNDDDDDESEVNIRTNHQYLPYFESSKVNRCIKVPLDENIKEPKYYRTVIQGIDSLNEGDLVLLNINSYGGQLDGAIALINAMDNTEADVHASIEGVAASAASLIALAAPSISVSPYATMMVHSATFGAFGKQSDVISHASFVDKQVRNLMNSVYKDFLTDKELEEVIMGKELWFDAEEIVRRLELRAELQEKRSKAEMKELKASLPKKPKVLKPEVLEVEAKEKPKKESKKDISE